MIDNYNEIQEQVKKVIEYSQNITSPKLDDIMKQWSVNKEWLFHAFGDKLIKSVGKMELKMSPEEKEKKFNNFLSNFEYSYLDSYNPGLVDYLKRQKEGFYKNEVIVETILADGTKIPAGMKLFKTFKYFFDENHKDLLYDYQTKASMIIQNNKVKGELCMSIHPLDFLSSSENNYNWRSCHSLDGEYRAGNLSYMADGCTFITYIRGENEEKLPNFPDDILWNNKKWRMLMFASESHNYLMAGRQYPFSIDDTVLNNLKIAYANSLAMSNSDWSDWHDDFIEEYQYKSGKDSERLRSKTLPIRGKFYAITDIVKDPEIPQHYNDLLHSSYYSPYYAWYKKATTKPNFEVGRECKCLRCGNRAIDSGGDSMLCSDCDDNNYSNCLCCSERIRIDYEGNAYYVNDEDGYICENCYNDYYFTCPDCDDVVNRDDGIYDEKTNQYYCKTCYKDLIEMRKEVQENGY